MNYKNKQFHQQDINIDGNEYIGCKFIRCNITYSGTASVKLGDSLFNQCCFTFDGPAKNTVGFMTGMYHDAGEDGKKLIEQTFENIRRGIMRKDDSSGNVSSPK